MIPVFDNFQECSGAVVCWVFLRRQHQVGDDGWWHCWVIRWMKRRHIAILQMCSSSTISDQVISDQIILCILKDGLIIMIIWDQMERKWRLSSWYNGVNDYKVKSYRAGQSGIYIKTNEIFMLKEWLLDLKANCRTSRQHLEEYPEDGYCTAQKWRGWGCFQSKFSGISLHGWKNTPSIWIDESFEG